MIEINDWNIDFENMRMWGHNKHTNELHIYKLFTDYDGDLFVQAGRHRVNVNYHMKTDIFWKQLYDAWIDYCFERDLLAAETDTKN